MKTVFTALLFSLAFALSAQVEQSQLIGKWQYQEPLNQDSMDSVSLAMTERFFADMTLEFNEEGICNLSMMGKSEDGAYEIKENNVIEVTPENGNVTTIKVVEVSEERLVVEIGKKMNAFIMTKVQDSEMTEVEE